MMCGKICKALHALKLKMRSFIEGQQNIIIPHVQYSTWKMGHARLYQKQGELMVSGMTKLSKCSEDEISRLIRTKIDHWFLTSYQSLKMHKAHRHTKAVENSRAQRKLLDACIMDAMQIVLLKSLIVYILYFNIPVLHAATRKKKKRILVLLVSNYLIYHKIQNSDT